MFTAVIDNPVLNYQVFPFFAEISHSQAEPIVRPGRGVWEIIDESELAGEITASASDTTSNPPAPDIDADEFEMLYQWFYA